MPSRVRPPWQVPADLAAILARDGMWESDRYAPISLCVQGGVRVGGREIICWQIELAPYQLRESPVAAVVGATANGHDWSEFLASRLMSDDPDLASRVQNDSENAACVLWVESEADCGRLVASVWSLVFGTSDPGVMSR